MDAMMEKVSPEEVAINKALYEYKCVLEKIKFGMEIKLRLIKMIREASSGKKAWAHLEKYESRILDGRFNMYSLSSKIRIICESREILDYFGLKYPDFPKSIKGLFEVDVNQGGESHGNCDKKS